MSRPANLTFKIFSRLKKIPTDYLGLLIYSLTDFAGRKEVLLSKSSLLIYCFIILAGRKKEINWYQAPGHRGWGP
jgi:hypothetical protein